MSDVAARAGVSRSAVSVALNGHRTVRLSPETIARIQQAAAELDYRPSHPARNLRLQRSGQIALEITLGTANPFAVTLLQPLLVAAEQHGYHVLAFTDSGDLKKYDELMHSGSVDAFLFTDSAVDDPRARFLAAAGFPFACYGRLADDLPPSWVDTDNEQATRLLIDHQLRAKPDAIAFYQPSHPAYWDLDRERTFRRCIAELGDAAPAARIRRLAAADLDRELAEILTGDDRWAIIASSHGIAVPLGAALRSRGVQIGTEVAIGVYDAAPMPWVGDPAFGTVAVPADVAARALLDCCLHEVNGVSGSTDHYLTAELVPGSFDVMTDPRRGGRPS